MKKLVVQHAITLLGVLLSASISKAAPQSFTEVEAASINAFLQEHFTDANYGFVIGLIDESGSQVFSAGKLDNDTEQQVDGDTIFEIGSITKTFTSLLLLEMAERGELKLDDPAAKYLPVGVKVPSRGGKEITLLNLAVQDSGLPFNATNLASDTWWKSFNAYTEKNMYAFLSNYDLTIKPGNRFQYSNIGMSLLGHVLERQSGLEYDDLVTRRICKPLEMNDTCIAFSAEQETRLARGHFQEGQRAPYYDFQVMAGAGALNSTANDMLKYLAAQLSLQQTPLEGLMKRTQKIRHRANAGPGNTAMPWMDHAVYQPAGSVFLGHGGGTIGFSTFLGLDTGRRRGVVVLSNQRITIDNQRPWLPTALGWSILQGLPLTRTRGKELVYQRVGFGIGLTIDEATTEVKISHVFAESPAGRAKLPAGLVLKKVGDASTQGLNLDECLQLIIGPEGTTERLEFLNPADSTTLSVELTREKFLTDG